MAYRQVLPGQWGVTPQQMSYAPYIKPSAQPLAQPSPQDLIRDRLAYDELQKRRKQIPEDTLLEYTVVDKGVNKLKTLFYTLPKTIWRGLKGSDDYTFADAMLVAKVPYYLGGLFLTLSPFIGGDKREGIRQGAAVLLYLLGTAGTHMGINTLYRMRYGVDLTMMYRSKTGQTEQVFASNDFPRFDLLTPRHYRNMAKRMGIPLDVYQPDESVKEHLRYIISNSRALKLIAANLLSAIGAGYIARSDAWLEVPKVTPVLKSIWKNPDFGIVQRAQKTISAISAALAPVIEDRFRMSGASWWRKGVVYGGLAALAGTVLYILFKGTPQKDYSRGTRVPLDTYYWDRRDALSQNRPSQPPVNASNWGTFR
jgi:hypothetical protein